MSHENTRIPYKPRTASLNLCLPLLFIVGFAVGASAQEVPPVETERNAGGTVEFLNRWRWLGGNQDVYRSTINLSEGPRLNAFTATFRKTNEDQRRLFDSLTVSTTGLGGEPYSSSHLNARLADSYDLQVNYKRFAYFNSLPSFANPFIGNFGASQSTFNIARRLAEVKFVFHPNAGISPYAAYDYDSGRGPARTDFVQDANEYAIGTNVDNATRTYRAGVALKFDRWSGGVEAGGSTFHDNQSVDFTGATTGNRVTLFLGQRLELDRLQQQYTVSGRDRFARAYGEYRPWSKLTLDGQFFYSRPTVTANYFDNGSGNLILLQTLQTFTGERTLTRSNARYPHPSGSVGGEFRPTRRMRVIESVSIDSFRISGSSTGTQTYDASTSLITSDTSALNARFTRQRLDAVLDLTSFASLHAGHSYLSANATSPGSVLQQIQTRDIHRQQEDVGAALRFRSRLKVNVDYRDDRGDATFFRTDGRRLRRLQVRGRYQVNESLQAGVSTSIWNNDNTASDINYFEKSRESSADITFSPKGGKFVTVYAGYTRGTLRSDLPFIVPQNYQTDHSIYRDRGHNGALAVTFNPVPRIQARLGGDFFLATAPSDSGSQTRPTRFYNPYGRVTLKLVRGASFVGGWSWHQYSNLAFSREAYHAHLLSTGMEYSF